MFLGFSMLGLYFWVERDRLSSGDFGVLGCANFVGILGWAGMVLGWICEYGGGSG